MKTHFTDNENLHTFFSFVSKAVLIIPIFIVVVSLFFKFNQPKKSPTLETENNTRANAQIPNLDASTKTNPIKFDLKGPIVCDSLFIKDKKVFLKNKSTNYLLNGDCIYIWDNGNPNGERKCGLSSYIGMAENYLGLFNIGDIINNNLVKDVVKDKGIDPGEIVKSCQRKVIKDDSIFNIPKKVLFKSK